MSYNTDELEAPQWVNSNFLKEVLEYNGDLKNVTVRKLRIFQTEVLSSMTACTWLTSS